MATLTPINEVTDKQFYDALRKLLTPFVERGEKPDYNALMAEMLDAADTDEPKPFTQDELNRIVALRLIKPEARRIFKHLSTQTRQPEAPAPDEDQPEAPPEAPEGVVDGPQDEVEVDSPVEAPTDTESEAPTEAVEPTDEPEAPTDEPEAVESPAEEPVQANPVEQEPQGFDIEGRIPADAPPIYFRKVLLRSGEKHIAFCTIPELRDEVLPSFVKAYKEARSNVQAVQVIIRVGEAKNAATALDVLEDVRYEL